MPLSPGLALWPGSRLSDPLLRQNRQPRALALLLVAVQVFVAERVALRHQFVHRAAEMLSFFRLSRAGRHYRRLVRAFQRVFAATIFFGSEDRPEPSQIFDWARFHFFDQIRVGIDHSPAGFGNSSEAAQNTTNPEFVSWTTIWDS